MDMKRRSWAKSLSWRIVGIVILGSITYLFTHSWGETASITFIFHAIRLVLYYFHERVWERIEWGRIKHPLAHLCVRDDLTSEDYEEIERFLAMRNYLRSGGPEYQI